MTFFTRKKKRVLSLAMLPFLFLCGMAPSFAQRSDTIGNGTTANSSDGPIIRGSNTANQYSYCVYLFTEEELVAKGIYPGAVIHSLSWRRGNSGAYNPTLINGATADWTISIKDGGTATKYTSGVNVYTYTSSGFSSFGTIHFDDASNNLPSLQEQWMTVFGAGSGYTYKGGSLEVYSNWAITSVPGAGNPTSIGAISWNATALPSTELRTIRNTSSTAITGPGTMTFFTSASRPNMVVNYTPAPDCSGTPATLTVADSSIGCPGRTFVNLQLQAFKPAPGLSIQWQSSTAGANNFSNLPGAVTAVARDTITTARDYRAVITCSASGLSSTTAVTAVTISAPAATPVTEDFSKSVLPPCWSMSSSNTNTAGAWLFSGSPTAGAAPASNGRAAGSFAWTDNSFKASDKTLYMPFVNLTGLAKPVLQFELFSNYTEIGKEATLTVDVLDSGTWTTVFTNKGSKATWRAYQVPLIAYAGKSVQVRFVVNETSTTLLANDILLDNVAIKEAAKCPEPSDIVVSNLNPTGATLNWTENGLATQWQVAYDTGVVNPAAAQKVITATKPLVLNMLRQASDYQVYVRSICGSGDTSAWSAITDVFSTTCPGSFAPPYTQNFAKWPVPCWETKVGRIETSLTIPATSNWRSTNWMHTGTTNKAAEINLSGKGKYEWLISPGIDLGTGTDKYQVEFDLAFLNSSTTPTVVGNADDTFSVVVSTDNGLSWKRADALYYWTMNNTPFDEGARHIVLDLDKYTGVVKLGLYAHSDSAGGNVNIVVDNISVSVIPSCRQPINTKEDRITHKSARLDWEEKGKATEWQIEYGPTGFTPGNGKRITANTKPYLLSDLEHSKDYDYYVRSVCGTNTFSAWSTVNSFRTLCVSTIPYAENFDGGNTFPVCMSQEHFLKESSSLWKVSTTSSNALSIPNYLQFDSYNYYGTANSWFYTPGLSLGADTSYTITFAYRTQYPQNYTEKFKIWMGNVATADSMTGSTPLYTGRIDTNIWKVDVIKVTPTKSGVYYLGFQCVSDSGYALFFDDISVVKTFVCYPPTGLTATSITTNGVNMGWTENNSATEWSLEYGPKGFTLGTGTRVRTNTNPYVLPVGLEDSTAYEFYVRSICSPGDTSKWSAAFGFSTQCIYPEVALGPDTTACAPYIVESKNLGLDHVWNTGEQTASIIAKTSGDYWVKVSKKNLCSSTDTIKLTLLTAPVVDSVTFEMTGKKQARFTAHVSGDAGSYAWEFGDGRTSTEESPVHDYDQADTFTVSLVVKNQCGEGEGDVQVVVEPEKDPEPEPDNIAAVNRIKQLIKVYPNPADHFVTVDNKSRQQVLALSLLSASGALMWENNEAYREQYTIQTARFAPGIYWLRVVTREGVITYKLELLR